MASSSLRQFQLTGVSDTGRIIGNGSYATAKELEFRGLKCVGKKIHQLLFDVATPQERAAMLQRFTEECELLSCLHHPYIVQFIGVHFEQGSQLPVLVMECLHTTLSDCLARYGILPETISYGILCDVALGLRYLHEHSPPIIHRDLSANNVLLTSSMSAKISDLGVAKILNITPAQMTQRMSTQAPGTPCYMPPEALMARPTYTSKIDSYSYGVMIIHVLCGRWPFPADAFRSDPVRPDTLVPVSEVDRRAEYLKDIDQIHPLMGLIHQCLSNTPPRRPETSEILSHISNIMSRIPETHQNEIEKLQYWEATIQDKQSQIESLTAQTQELMSQTESLTTQTKTEVEVLRAEVKRLSVRSPCREGESGQSSRPPQRPAPLPPQRPQPRSQQQSQLHPHMDSQPTLLHPQAKLHWRKVANLPVGMTRPQVIVVGEKVFVGGGIANSHSDYYLAFQYDPASDEWTTLPRCPLHEFGLGQLLGVLLIVGGMARNIISGKVYRYKPESKQWEESLQPMPTARKNLFIISTQSALIACGGATSFSGGKAVLCSTVEVYTTQTSQWHIADSLPSPCRFMSSAIITNTGYLLGGQGDIVLYAPIASLIQKATSRPQQSASPAQPNSTSSVWKKLSNTPLMGSTAASLGKMLLAVGGRNYLGETLPAVYVYFPATSSWIQVESGDLPEPRFLCTAIELSANRLLVIGGSLTEVVNTTTVFLGSVICDMQ